MTVSIGTTPARVVLFGEFGSENYGNDASLAAILSWLGDATDKALLAITRGPDRVSSEFDIRSVSMHADRRPFRWLPRPLRGPVGKVVDLIRLAATIRPTDVIIIPGSGAFEQKLAGPAWGFSLNLLSLAVAARIRHAQLAFVGVGAAVDSRAVVRAMTRTTLRTAKFLTFRDAQTKTALQLTGVDVDGCQVVPDIVLSEQMMQPARRPRAGSLTVAVGVIQFYDRSDPQLGAATAARYEDAVSRFCCWLAESGHQVDLLTGDKLDEPVALRVLSQSRLRSPENAAKINFEPVDRYTDLLDHFRSADVVVGSRYHNLIFGLINGLPIMSVGYARKCSDLAEAAGLGRHSVPLEEATAELLIARFSELANDLDDARSRVAGYQRQVADRSADHRARLLDFIQAPQRTRSTAELLAPR